MKLTRKYLVSVHKSSTTKYMIKMMGGEDNILTCTKNPSCEPYTEYFLEILDSSKITPPQNRGLKIKQIG